MKGHNEDGSVATYREVHHFPLEGVGGTAGGALATQTFVFCEIVFFYILVERVSLASRPFGRTLAVLVNASALSGDVLQAMIKSP